MTRTVRLDDEARDEIIAAAQYYESRERGRGELFSEAAFARIEALTVVANAGSPVRGVGGVLVARQVRMRRYPYLIVYVVSEDQIRVVAVAHEKQMPMYWAARLGG